MDFQTATLHVRRVKQGTTSPHPIRGDELRALRRLQREQEPTSPFVFTSEPGGPFSTGGFARMLERVWEGAKLDFKATHTCSGTPAAMLWQTEGTIPGPTSLLGHRNIQHTVRYTELPPTRFKDFWRD